MKDYPDVLVDLTAEVAIAFFSHNTVPVGDIAKVIAGIHEGLSATVAAPASVDEVFTPAVTERASIKPDALISMIDGKPYKMLRRHLTNHGLTPESYRARYGLKADYPMVAPNYSAKRRELALNIGLGRKAGQKAGKRTGQR